MPVVKKQSVRKKRPAKKTAKKAKSVIDRIGDDWGDAGLKINLYGRSGSGKTTLWGTFPKPILAIVASGGKSPGELKSLDTAANRKVIKPVSIHSLQEFDALIEHQEQGEKYATVVLDHATGLQDFTLKEVLDLDKVPAQLSWGLATQQQYGQVALQMKERLGALLSLSCNVVVVAQEREFNTDAEGDLLMPYVASALTPSVTGWLNPACDYICQTFLRQKTVEKSIKIGKKTVKKRVKAKGVDYCLRTGPDAVFTTKFRVPKGRELPEILVDPSYEDIRRLVEGK